MRSHRRGCLILNGVAEKGLYKFEWACIKGHLYWKMVLYLAGLILYNLKWARREERLYCEMGSKLPDLGLYDFKWAHTEGPL